jgi:hypothetical protein
LFACACVRTAIKAGPNESGTLIESIEKIADGLLVREKLGEIREQLEGGLSSRSEELSIDAALMAITYDDAFAAALWASAYSAATVGGVGFAAARQEQMLLLDHILANPIGFQSPTEWDAATRDLAQAVYQGQDCAFALHDRLCEVGSSELARHFVATQAHPKGCAVLDLILNKT